MIHLYCLAVQAGFYSDAVECSPVTQAARVRFPAAALVIRSFSPITQMSDGKLSDIAVQSISYYGNNMQSLQLLFILRYIGIDRRLKPTFSE